MNTGKSKNIMNTNPMTAHPQPEAAQMPQATTPRINPKSAATWPVYRLSYDEHNHDAAEYPKDMGPSLVWESGDEWFVARFESNGISPQDIVSVLNAHARLIADNEELAKRGESLAKLLRLADSSDGHLWPDLDDEIRPALLQWDAALAASQSVNAGGSKL